MSHLWLKNYRLVPGLSVIGHQYLRPSKHLKGFTRATANGSA